MKSKSLFKSEYLPVEITVAIFKAIPHFEKLYGAILFYRIEKNP